jgi:hypothetical protein
MALIMDDRRKPNKDTVEITKMLTELSEKVDDLDGDLILLTGRFDTHEKAEADKFSAMINVVTENTTSIKELVIKTQTVIDISQNAEGFLNTSKYIASLLMWCGKFGSLVGLLIYVALTIKNKLGL